jgi:hypothetical protein
VLFIDTLHTGPQVFAELEQWAASVNRYIAFHDTETFGVHGEHGEQGLQRGIADWLATAEGQRWEMHLHRRNNNGLTIYRRK